MISLFSVAATQSAIQLAEPFVEDYELVDLGPIAGVPMNYGGLAFKPDNPNTLLIGGNANRDSGALYAVSLLRGEGNRIIGFAGGAEAVISAPYNDGGVVYGPGNVLFLARYPVNQLGQVRPGSATTDKIIGLGPLGISASPGGLAFVPGGFPGAGRLMLASYSGGAFYSMNVVPDGTGLFSITNVIHEAFLSGGPEGFIYVPPGSPQFTDYRSMLVSAYSVGRVDAYEIDDAGVPLQGTRRTFISGLTGAEGAAVDPLTGDFLFSTWGAGVDRVIVVSGFLPPAAANAGLSMTGTLETLFTGQMLTLTLGVTNAGPSEATGLWVTLDLPPGVAQISAVPSAGDVQISDQVVTWGIPAMIATGHEELTVDLVLTRAGEWRHEALLTLSEVDPDLSDNSAVVTTQVEPVSLNVMYVAEEGELLFSWPSALDGWVLQSAPRLPPPDSWETLEIAPIEEVGLWRTSIPIPTERTMFFRLMKEE